ncbi:riboflavin synthase [Shouchella shacheensis]|uniref:riboflavin synthase n=1 Tax=Shouchella shacheensis TaxID=1649580 RepID=UPI00073FF57E|nr:riboflavin synthase [Shouchella shacheensis]
MFTGIIEEKGTVQNIEQTGQAMRVTIGASHVLTDVATGDSISVNGVCLTVTLFETDRFACDVMPETVKASTFSNLKSGSSVNLERAMAAGGRFGGHMVSGHVDGVGRVVKRTPSHNAVYFEIQASPDVLRYVVQKGSVAVEGTSLTVFDVTEDSFTISIIPHTLEETTIGEKQEGDAVNVECDMIGKYVEKMLKPKESKAKEEEFQELLENNGFY